MTELIPIISENEIKKKVSETGLKISRDYKNKKPCTYWYFKGLFYVSR